MKIPNCLIYLLLFNLSFFSNAQTSCKNYEFEATLKMPNSDDKPYQYIAEFMIFTQKGGNGTIIAKSIIEVPNSFWFDKNNYTQSFKINLCLSHPGFFNKVAETLAVKIKKKSGTHFWVDTTFLYIGIFDSVEIACEIEDGLLQEGQIIPTLEKKSLSSGNWLEYKDEDLELNKSGSITLKYLRKIN